MLTLDKAIAFAVEKHTGQKDKGGNSYVRHILRVMESMDCEDEMVVAVLHDVLEDTNAKVEDLQTLGCTESQVNSIMALTKREGQTKEDYCMGVMKSTVARKVKIADIEDNMQLWRMKNRHSGLTEKDILRLNKYLWMWTKLKGE